MFRQKDPKPLAPGRGPRGAFAPVPIAWASFDFRRGAPYAQDERIITPRSSFPPPFVLSVAKRSRRALRQSSPQIEFSGPGRSHARRRQATAFAFIVMPGLIGHPVSFFCIQGRPGQPFNCAQDRPFDSGLKRPTLRVNGLSLPVHPERSASGVEGCSGQA